MHQSTKHWVWALLIVGGLVTGFKALLNPLFEDFKGRGEYESQSVDEARDRGILVAEVVAEPAELDVPGGRIQFGQAWIEERSLPTHRLVWFPAERRIGGYRLHFTVAKVVGVGKTHLFFVAGDERKSVSESWSEGEGLYFLEVASPDISELRLSAVRSWNEPRPKNIRFIPKK